VGEAVTTPLEEYWSAAQKSSSRALPSRPEAILFVVLLVEIDHVPVRSVEFDAVFGQVSLRQPFTNETANRGDDFGCDG